MRCLGLLLLLAAATAAVAPPPTITGFAPKHGLVGEKVTVYGHGLAGAQVQFNGQQATDAVVDSAGTHITSTVPPETTTGPGPLLVITPGGTVSPARSRSTLRATREWARGRS